MTFSTSSSSSSSPIKCSAAPLATTKSPTKKPCRKLVGIPVLNGSKQQQCKDDRTVSFGHVDIIHYERILTNNPACSSGPPIGIGWAYYQNDKECMLRIDEYEAKPRRRRRQKAKELILKRSKREQILLHEWGVSRAQLSAAVRRLNKDKFKRRQTANNNQGGGAAVIVQHVEEMIESAKSRVKNILLLKYNNNKQK